MADPDTQEPISNLSDNSFVILGQGSLPPEMNDDINQKLHLDSPTTVKDIYSILDSSESGIGENLQNKGLNGSELCEEEIQKKFEELLKENCQLKEILTQNNLAIKSQLDTFFMWQQEVLKTHETHKQKFLETKDLILKLRGENASLKKQLESLPGVSYVRSDELCTELNKKPEELSKLKENVREYEIVCNDLTGKNENLESENQKLKDKLKVVRNEVLKLNKEIEDLGRENLYLKNNLVHKISFESLSPKSLPNAEARAQISNLIKQLEEEKAKTLKLKELIKEKAKSGGSSILKLSIAEQLNHYIDNLNEMNNSLDMQNQRFSSFQSWVSLAEETLKDKEVESNLMCEIKELKSHLNKEENVFKEKQKSLQELNEQFNRLLGDYKTLQVELSSIKNSESCFEKYKEDLLSLSAKLELKDQELINKQKECDNLKEAINKLNLDSEEVAALRIQVQLYESDFNEEKARREKLAEEKEEITKEVRLLQSKIEALEKDGGQINYSVHSPLESPGRKSKYMCPKCMFSFSDLSACEEHIDQCLNIQF